MLATIKNAENYSQFEYDCFSKRGLSTRRGDTQSSGVGSEYLD
jgi:hypothetical protein